MIKQWESDHSNCLIRHDIITTEQCEKLTKLSFNQIHDIALDIHIEVKEQKLDINECLKVIDNANKNDIELNVIEWIPMIDANAIGIGNFNSSNSETCLLKKITKYLFISMQN